MKDKALEAKRAKTIKRVTTLVRVMDRGIRIPGTKQYVGLDPVIGLVPVGGDIITAFISAYVVIEAWRIKEPTSVLFEMIANIIIDALGGAIPIVGDIFDFVYRANDRNLKLLGVDLDEEKK